MCISFAYVILWHLEMEGTVYLSVRAAVTKCHGLVGLKNRNLFSCHYGVWKVQDQDTSKFSVWSLQAMTPGSLCIMFSMAFSWCARKVWGKTERQQEIERMWVSSVVSCYKDTNLWKLGLTLMSSFNLNHFLRNPVSKYSFIGG